MERFFLLVVFSVGAAIFLSIASVIHFLIKLKYMRNDGYYKENSPSIRSLIAYAVTSKFNLRMILSCIMVLSGKMAMSNKASSFESTLFLLIVFGIIYLFIILDRD